jgi:hypothetical protein
MPFRKLLSETISGIDDSEKKQTTHKMKKKGKDHDKYWQKDQNGKNFRQDQ